MGKVHKCTIAEFKDGGFIVPACGKPPKHFANCSPSWLHVTCKRCLKKRPGAEVVHEEAV